MLHGPSFIVNTGVLTHCSVLSVDLSHLKLPFFVPSLSVDETSDGAMDRFDTQIVISQQGHVMWLAPKIIISNCKFDVSNFPFDEQVQHNA